MWVASDHQQKLHPENGTLKRIGTVEDDPSGTMYVNRSVTEDQQNTEHASSSADSDSDGRGGRGGTGSEVTERTLVPPTLNVKDTPLTDGKVTRRARRKIGKTIPDVVHPANDGNVWDFSKRKNLRFALLEAVREGDEGLLSSLVSGQGMHGPPLSSSLYQQYLLEAFTLALNLKKTHMAQLLISSGLDIRSSPKRHHLLYNAVSGQVEGPFWEFLLQQDCNLLLGCPNTCILELLCMQGHLPLHVLSDILSKYCSGGVLFSLRASRSTLLHAAVKGNQHGLVMELLENYQATKLVNVADCNGNTPLYLAALNNARETVEALLREGANAWPGAFDTQKLPLLATSDEEIQDVLLKRMGGPTVVDGDGNTALHCAAKFGSNKTIGFLLEKGCDINAKNNSGYTPLMLVLHGIEAYKFLKLTALKQDAKLRADVLDPEGMSIFHLVNTGNESTLNQLNVLKDMPGANVNQPNQHGVPALHKYYECCTSWDKVCEWFANNGADLNFVTQSGKSLLDIWLTKCDLENDLKCLISNNIALRRLTRPAHIIHEVINKEKFECIPLLVQGGCDLGRVDRWLENVGTGLLQNTGYGHLPKWLAHIASRVPSLKETARSAILENMGHARLKTVFENLYLPKQLQEYLEWGPYLEVYLSNDLKFSVTYDN